MKTYIALLLTLGLLLSLAACGEDTTPGSTDPQTGNAAPEQPSGGEDQTQIQDVPFGDYHSEEELLAMLESGDFSEYLSVDPEAPADPVDTGGDEPYAGFSNSIIFTDGGSAEGVEYPDFMSQLSPEMQAQWAEMEQELTDLEMMEMFEGMEGMEESGSDQP